MYTLTDSASGISVFVQLDNVDDRAIYRFSTDAKAFAVPDDIAGRFDRRLRLVPPQMIAFELLRDYSRLRPYASSKSLLM